MLVILAVLVGVGMWQTGGKRAGRGFLVLSHEPQGIMGTTCTISTVVLQGGEEIAGRAISEAENTLRKMELLMSSWLSSSEISRFNIAGAGIQIELAPESMKVLRHAHSAFEKSGGAFDVTIGPLIRLWRQGAERNLLPSEEEISDARTSSNWDQIELNPTGALKKVEGTQVDLGGITKGFAIDLAVEVMEETSIEGGLVDVGGDIRVFGTPHHGQLWKVDIRDPSGDGIIKSIGIRSGAVCTSGDYSRFYEIEGRRFSHIIDPRTGWPAAVTASVTVYAETALDGDIWATTLSVLGIEGLKMLPQGMEAMLIVKKDDGYSLLSTPGFRELFLVEGFEDTDRE